MAISRIPIISASISTLIFSILSSDKLLGNKVAMRNGPDLIGWISSSKYFCKHDNLVDLETKIVSDLNIANVLDAFRNPLVYAETSIYRVSSVSTQAIGEFLVGARRIGIPGIQGEICQIVGENHLISIVLSFSLIAIFVSTYICGMIVRDFQISKVLRFLIPVLAIMNFNSISVFLEGGYGQLLATPFFLYAIYNLTRSNIVLNQIGFSSFLIILFSLGTYFDLALIFGFFIFLMWVCNLMLTKINILKTLKKMDLNLIGASLFLGIPGLLSAPRLLLNRLGSGTYGGWDQGRIPTPSNFFGLINWLPPDGVNSYPRSISLTFIEIISSMCIVFFLFRNISNIQTQPILVAFIVYSFLMIVVYLPPGESNNNYTIWKAAGYLSMLLVLFAFLENWQNNNADKFSRLNMLSKATISICILSTIISSFNWTDSWLKGRQFNFNEPDKKMGEIINEYDLIMNGFEGAGSYKMLLIGDIHYLAESRGFSVLSKRSVPARNLAFVLPKKCMNLDCELRSRSLNKNDKFEIIYSNDEYIVYAQSDS